MASSDHLAKLRIEMDMTGFLPDEDAPEDEDSDANDPFPLAYEDD
jgi:hypothetical protein